MASPCLRWGWTRWDLGDKHTRPDWPANLYAARRDAFRAQVGNCHRCRGKVAYRPQGTPQPIEIVSSLTGAVMPVPGCKLPAPILASRSIALLVGADRGSQQRSALERGHA